MSQWSVNDNSDYTSEYTADECIQTLISSRLRFLGFATIFLNRESAFQWGLIALLSSRYLSLLTQSEIYQVSFLDGKDTVSLSVQFHTQVSMMLPINNPDFENYLHQTYPVELGNKYATESNTSRPNSVTEINFFRSGGTFNVTFPFMKKATYRISTTQDSIPE